MVILTIIMFILFMGFLPVFAQGNCGINDAYFKRIKVKRLGFLFRGVDWESASKRGLIKSLFIIQIIGYILMLLSTILVFILLFAVNVEDNIKLTIIVISSILVAEVIAVIVVIVITGAVAKRREENNYTVKNK